MSRQCSHVALIKTSNPNSDGCEDCLAIGDSWVHLRLCRICGHVGCCDSSKNKHASKHFASTQHAIITSLESGENWSWCYVDQLVLQVS